jgi:hypothetical protein
VGGTEEKAGAEAPAGEEGNEDQGGKAVSDTFGDFWTDDDSQGETATATGDQPMLPDGKHVGKIVVAEVKDLSFKINPGNPTGTTFAVKLAVNGYQLVEDLVPIAMRGVIQAIYRSAGIDAPTKGESFEAACARLKGQTAPVESTLAKAPSGREYIRLKWLPGVKPLPASARTETRAKPKAAKPVDEAPDDIPF